MSLSTIFRRFGLLALAAGSTAFAADISVTSPGYPATDYSEQSPGKPGGVLRASASYVPDSLDVHIQKNGNLLWEGRLIYDSLVYLDPTGQATPWLARSWSVSPDGRTYTFRLREDVTFSDGTRFDAAAVQANLDRIKTLGPKSQLASAYIEPYVDARVLGDFTLEVHLASAFPDFLSYLAQSWLGLVSPRQIRENPGGIKTNPIGTGPFVVAENDPGKRTVFKRRADYAWAPDVLHHAGPAYLEGIVLESVPDEAARAAALRSGQHDLSLEAPLLDIATLRADPRFVVSNRVRPGSPMRSLAFNTARPPFDDVRLRRAAALAINRQPIADLIAPGEFLSKNDFLGATTRGYDASFKDALAYNPTAANAALDAAGWNARGPDGIRLKNGQRLAAELLTTGDERTPPASVLAMQSDLRKVGLDLRLITVKSAELTERVRAGRYDALAGGWWTSPTADVLFLLYHSSQRARQNSFGQDTARISDPVLDDLLLRARQTPDGEARLALYRDAQRLLTELVPVVPLHESHHVIAYDRRLHGLLFDTVHNTPILTAAWLEGVPR